MAIVCRRVLYVGRVQGVGFRYTALRIARGFSIAGYVRNLRDGRVELVAEGEAAEVSAFVTAVNGRWSGSITDITATDALAEGLAGFTIRS
jgi:acylphosphatase